MPNMVKYKEIRAFHPGRYIQDILDDEHVTVEEYAERLGMDVETLDALVNGEIPMTLEIAEKLSNYIGTGVNLWINLQKNYVKSLAEIEAAKLADRQEALKRRELTPAD